MKYSVSSKPLVSVIVPNYNYGRYLDLRLSSIFMQTYDNYEVVILDDKSTDGSLLVIDKYRSHPKVSKIIINETNSGSPFVQWKKGILESNGEIIWIAESDDTCSPLFLEILVEAYIESNAKMAFCRSIIIDENEEKIKDSYQMPKINNNLVMEGKRFIEKYLCYSNEIQNASSAIFSKEAALMVDDEFMSYKGAGDWLFWINICLLGNICFVNKKLNNYRVHNNTTLSTVKSGKEFYEMKRIYEWLLQKEYISNNVFSKCRKNNILIIRSLNVIPPEVKSELYSMWKVSKWECYRIVCEGYYLKIISSLKDRIKKHQL